jgi:8-oxo-dGTP pyrophosphatase MutT (NUDIX family)
MSFITEYVLGFALDDRGNVALIKKTRPTWQKGRWNGIGGHREGLEQPREAMRREFLEETGVDTDPTRWVLRGRMFCENAWRVQVYSYQFDSTPRLKQVTDELPAWHRISDVKAAAYPVSEDLYIENLPALIALCSMPSDHTGCVPQFTMDYTCK